MLAAAPAWFADNVALIAYGTLLVLTVLVVRLVQKATLRFAMLAVIGAIAVFAYANRAELKECATTCECQLFDKHLTVPGCSSNLSRS